MEKKENKYTLLSTLGSFFSMIGKSLRAWSVTLFYGAIITASSSVFERIHFCRMNDLKCYITTISLFVLFVFILIMFYLYDLYQTAFKNSVFKIKNFIRFDKNKIKSIGVLLGYFLCFVISALISWKIFTKPANPNWKIEFIYFTIFFIFCMLPVLAMRFSSVVAFYFNDYKLPSFKYLYKRTEGRSYIGIIGFLMVLLFLSVFNAYGHSVLTGLFADFPLPVTADVLRTFCYVLLILFTFSVFLCFFEAQRLMLAESEYEPADTLIADDKEKKVLLTDKTKQKKDGKKTGIKTKEKSKR